MATLFLDRKDLELRIDGAAVAIYEPAGRRGTVPLHLLDRVVMQGRVKLDTGVLTKLAELGIATLLLSARHSRRLAIVLGAGHNQAAIRLAQSRRVFDQDWCAGWAARQVGAKLRTQSLLLTEALLARPDARKPLTDALAEIAAIAQQLGSVPAEPTRLLGFEGAAARSYFAGLAALLPPSLGFVGRNRRPPRDPVNACLSLGYTLLHFDAVRACHGAGLDPLLGFYHRPSFGRESLACDLIEPLRARIDLMAWQLFRDRSLRAEHFSNDQGACLLGKAGRGIFFQRYEQQAAPARRALRRQCRILARHFTAEGEPLLGHDDEAL